MYPLTAVKRDNIKFEIVYVLADRGSGHKCVWAVCNNFEESIFTFLV